MDNVLFRGLRTDGGGLVYGYVFPIIIDEKTRRFIIPCGAYCPKTITIEELQVEVIPETVGQYIGREDKNGVKIFKGDKVLFYTQRHKEGIIKVVEWDDQGMWLPFRDDEYIQDEQGDWFDEEKGFEVVSNISE